MLVSIDWLKELLPALNETPDAIAGRLTAAGLEVEGLTSLAAALDGVVVAEVKKVEPHPKADKLRLATVSDGAEEQVVVCGAPNVAEGQKVALAKLGVTLPNGLTMEPRKIRGVASAGMLCAEDELGLSDDHDGIMVLPPETAVGTPVSAAVGLTDVVLELGVTPNRPDALSQLGVAREFAALAGLEAPERTGAPAESGEAASALASVGIEAPEACGRYAARVITGVKLGPSPKHVQERLRAVGQRPISNIVDATNVVLMELGQPLHAFDLDRLVGEKVSARLARKGEVIELLDGSKKKLHPDDLVIADAERPVALAGVMGGANSEVGEEGQATTRVLLESAWFNPSRVRKTAKRHGLHTEASHRFERGVDPEGVVRALDRAAALIVEWAGGTVHPGVLGAEGQLPERAPIPIRAARAASLIGRSIDDAEVKACLTALGLVPAEAPADGPEGASWWLAPSWRVDLEIEADLIEEVGRFAGYDAVEAAMPSGSSAPWRTAPERDPEAEARQALVGAGFYETISLAFVSPAKGQAFLPEGRAPVRVANPLGEETGWMRSSLLPALLDAARHNQDLLPSQTNLRLFELGGAFAWGESETLPEEDPRVGILLRGRRAPISWASGTEMVDVFDLKGVLEGFFDAFRVEPDWEAGEQAWLHPRSSTRLVQSGRELGWMGELHPDLAEQLGLEGPPVFVAELSLAALEAARGELALHRTLPKLPPAQRDLSFFVDQAVPSARLLSAARTAGADNLEGVRLFDVYEGKGVPEGQRSLAIELVFRAADRTLADAEVDAAVKTVVSAVAAQTGARLRDG